MKHAMPALACSVLLGCGDDGATAAPEGSSGSTSSTTAGSATAVDETGETTTSSEDSSTTGPQPCMGNEDCPDAAAPFCEPVSGECIGCNQVDVVEAEQDAACATRDPARPLCVDGVCRACEQGHTAWCDAQGLVCDEQTHECTGCTAHDQCGSGACELFEGRCFPEDAVFHVDEDRGYYPTLAIAMLAVGTMEMGRVVLVLHEPQDGSGFEGPVVVDDDLTLAMLAAPGDEPRLWVSGDTPTVTVAGPASTLYMDGIQVSGNASSMDPGVRVDGGRAWLDHSRVVQNTGGGIVAQNAGELVLRNCFVGGDVSDTNALEIDGATATVLYSTVAAGTFNAAALTCTSPLAVQVRNSILVSRGGVPPDEVACATAEISYSTAEGMVAGAGNAPVGMFPGGMPELWFVDYTAGDYHLQNDGLTLFADIAQWQTGDPATDIDGDPRPGVEGSLDHAGADVP